MEYLKCQVLYINIDHTECYLFIHTTGGESSVAFASDLNAAVCFIWKTVTFYFHEKLQAVDMHM